MSSQAGRSPHLIIAALVVVMLLVGFGAGFLLKPSNTETTTNLSTITLPPTTYTTTVTPNEGSNVLNCVVTHYIVQAAINGSVTQSKVLNDFTTTTSVEQSAGYSTSTVISQTAVFTGPIIALWNATVCTWLP